MTSESTPRCASTSGSPASKSPKPVDLLLKSATSRGEVLTERCILDYVPPDGDSEPEPAFGEEVDFGGLFGDEGPLSLRYVGDSGDEFKVERTSHQRWARPCTCESSPYARLDRPRRRRRTPAGGRTFGALGVCAHINGPTAEFGWGTATPSFMCPRSFSRL